MLRVYYLYAVTFIIEQVWLKEKTELVDCMVSLPIFFLIAYCLLDVIKPRLSQSSIKPEANDFHTWVIVLLEQNTMHRNTIELHLGQP